MDSSNLTRDENVQEGGEDDNQQFQSKFVESSYQDTSSQSSAEEIEHVENEIIHDDTLVNQQQPQEDDLHITLTVVNDASATNDQSPSKKLVRNPITLVEEYHSSSSLSSYNSHENIFPAIVKDIDISGAQQQMINSTINELEVSERPGRKLSISASSIPFLITSQSESTVSPLALSCSAPSLPGVLALVSSQEKEITLIQAQPLSSTTTTTVTTTTVTTTTFNKDLQQTTSNKPSRSKNIFQKLRKSKRTSTNYSSSGNLNSGSESISPSTSTSSNLSASSTSSGGSTSHDGGSSSDPSKRDKKKKWRLRLSSRSSTSNSDKEKEKELKEEEQNVTKEDQEITSTDDRKNIIPISAGHSNEQENIVNEDILPVVPTTTTTTTTTTNTDDSNLSDNPRKNSKLNQHFISTSLPEFGNGSGSSLGGLCDLENSFDGNSSLMSFDDEIMPRGGRGRSNAFYMKGAPLINHVNGEFKISIPKLPSLPNLVQLSLPAILPKESYSLLSKPISVFSKFKSKSNLNTSFSNLNNLKDNNNNKENKDKDKDLEDKSEKSLDKSEKPSDKSEKSSDKSEKSSDKSEKSIIDKEKQERLDHNLLIQNFINKVVKSNSSRFIVGFADTIGRRPTMEDQSVICGTFRGKSDEDYIALFDGHGGSDASNLTSLELHKILIDKLKSNSNNPVKSLKESFQSMNQILKEKNIRGGTTAVVALFLGRSGYIANVGDSRAVLCCDDKAIRVSLDHKPNLPREEERIRKLGGTVTTTVSVSGITTSRVNGQLSVSRALGDHFLQPYVSCEPDIHGPINLDPRCKNQFMILACDGLWDVMTDDEAVEMALPLVQDPEKACIKLREEAYGRGSTDNISIVIIKFSPIQASNI